MTFPYVPSGGVIQQAVDQFKKALPAKIDAATLKKLGVAPSNEGYVINTLKFLGIVDDQNDRTDVGVELFSTHGDEAFSKAFEKIIYDKYSALFELRGQESWSLDRDALISFFRASDKTTAIVGARQAVTFAALASMAGKRAAAPRNAQPSAPRPRAAAPVGKTKAAVAKAPTAKAELPASTNAAKQGESDVALTVRIEINLPANGSQATYDNIFKSIRANLLNQNA